MISQNRRTFFKKVFCYGAMFSLLGVTSNILFNNSSLKFINKDFYLMGTKGKLQFFTNDLSYGEYLVEKTLNRIQNIELMLTKFSPDSIINKISRNIVSYNEVPTDVLRVLKLGVKISKMTNNYFDMGMGNLLYSAGIDNMIPIVGNVTTLKDMNINLLSISGNKVRLNRKNTMLDLGGIGKGYAIDVAMEMLIDSGIKHAIIEFGGDIRAYGGMPSGLPWKISFDNNISYALNLKNEIYLKNGSIASSGGYLKRSKMKNCDIKHHIIDPKSLKTKDEYVLSLVKGEKATICDALATSCYNMDNIDLAHVKKKFSNYEIKVYV